MDYDTDQPKPAPDPEPSPEHSSADPAFQDPQHLVLTKGSHRWVIRYRNGEETEVLRVLRESAGDPRVDLDWFDAAVLSHQMGGKMQQQLKKLISE
jgi:hypothetical protein